MAGPNTSIVQQLPISIFSGWDKVQDVLNVLAQHDYGQFRSSAILVDAMWRDDRVKGVLNARTGSLLATPMEHKPANASRKAKKAAEIFGGSEDDPGGVFDLICPPDVLWQLAGWMVTMGICVAELIWIEHPTIKVGKYPMWIPRLRPWHPQFVYWDWASFSYKLITREGTIDLPRTDTGVYSDGKWFVYCPDGYQYGWLRAAVRSLAMLYISRGWANRDWSRHSEVHGQAVRKAYVPEAADDLDKQNFFNSVANVGGELAVMVPVGEGGRDKGYDVVYEEAKARTWECMKDLVAGKNVDIAVDLLGQNMTTELSGSGLGAGAVAHVQNQVRMDVRQRDAKLVPALRNQVASWWARYNFGDPELAPRSKLQVEPPEDELAEATALKMLGDGLQSVKAADEGLDVAAVVAEKGLPRLSEEEIAAEKAVAMEAQQAIAGQLGPGAAGDKGPKDDSAPGEKKPAELAQASLAFGGGPHQLGEDHLAGKRVPKGGASCASCTFLTKDLAGCTNIHFLTWNHGNPERVDPVTGLAQAVDRYLCDWYEERPMVVAYEPPTGNEIRLPPNDRPPVMLLAAHPTPGPVMRREFQGLPIAVENREGSIRHWYERGAATPKGSTKMLFDYGYIEGHTGADGEELDVYLGPDESATLVHVVHQLQLPGYKHYDEDKLFLGFSSADAARAAYVAHRNDGEQAIGGMSSMPLERFKAKLKRRTGRGKITASAAALPLRGEVIDVVGALEALAQRSTAPRAELRTLAGKKRAARYADRLTLKARKLAARALAVDLTTLKGEIEKATSFEDLKARIVRAYRDKMSPDRLAKVVQKANLMAHLYGRLEAVDSL